jgi:hypothetical protein
MKRVLVVLIGIGVAATAGWRLAGAQDPQPTDFQVVLEVTPEGWEATCDHGCNWQRLAYRCPANIPCRARLDQTGVRGLPPED